MYLKNIEVQGFKSFAQKINFEFHNGITGIVGPNGSGKSNVADAVRWVLGEQSAKQLRGGNMQDVIFSGTETRKPLSYAYVAITLDNSDRALNLDYNEVTVSRRLYRSGESEYMMNGASCRLRDINELFYDTGIGKEGYSIIGQGQIDKILSGKPEDRRELFDEAAGIVKFKRRKNATIKKLNEERQNLTRVTDILSELTRQLGPLKRQSEAARVYLARRDTMKNLDIQLFLMESEEYKTRSLELKNKYDLASEELSQTRTQYDQIKAQYDQINEEQEAILSKIDDLSRQSSQTAINRQQSEGQILLLKEQISSSQATSQRDTERINAIQLELKKREEDQAAYTEELRILKGDIKSIHKDKDQMEEKLSNIREEIRVCTSVIEEGKKEIIEILNNRSNTKGRAQHFDTMLEQLKIRQSDYNKQLLSKTLEEKNCDRDTGEAQALLKEIEDMLHKDKENLSHVASQLDSLSAKEKEKREELSALQTSYHRQASRLESLKNIAERYDGYGSSIRRVMEQKNRRPGILGVVADLIHTEKIYETAIETALGGSIQNIVTRDEATAKDMIAYLKKNKAGRATFLPLDGLTVRDNNRRDYSREKGVIGYADSLIETDAQYEILKTYLLGRVLVVDNIDNALLIARRYKYSIRMVTLEGELLNPGGSLTGGAFKNTSNLLGRRREIEELEGSVKELTQKLAGVKGALDQFGVQSAHLKEERFRLNTKIQEHTVEQNTRNISLETCLEKSDNIKSDLTRIRHDIEELNRQAMELKSDHAGIEEELNTSRRDEEELDQFIENRQEELDKWTGEEAFLTSALETIKIRSTELTTRESFIEENISRIKDEIRSRKEEKEELKERTQTLLLEAEEKEADIIKLNKTMEDYDSRLAELKDKLTIYQKEKEEKAASLKRFFDERDSLSEKINLLDKEVFRLNSQSEKLEEHQESRISYLWEEYQLTPNSPGMEKNKEYNDKARMKKELSDVRAEIKGLGNVNVNAIEEYKEVSQRHEFLTKQYDDLTEAARSLETIIGELDEGMRKQFAAKFKDIQREFDKAFKELFGGGKGTLELIEDEDILEAGVRIISQPPGKKLQNMMQLSGGEKALTAIALLFAIQNLKPSPFCLLDEIEAALDDSNVGRFAGYLQKLTKNTQFIIITHRRGTMTAADRLYGITMQEKGVSALVSVDLVENQLTG